MIHICNTTVQRMSQFSNKPKNGPLFKEVKQMVHFSSRPKKDPLFIQLQVKGWSFFPCQRMSHFTYKSKNDPLSDTPKTDTDRDIYPTGQRHIWCFTPTVPVNPEGSRITSGGLIIHFAQQAKEWSTFSASQRMIVSLSISPQWGTADWN